jgi:hypothetical protein
MSEATLTTTMIANAHRAFDDALGRIDSTLSYHFRRLPRTEREEAIAEAHAYTWSAWHGLLRRGKDPVAVGVLAIANNSCRAVKNGRSVGTRRSSGLGALDVLHPRTGAAAGFRVVSLDDRVCAPADSWRDAISSGGRYGPAEEAGFRIDFAAWLDTLPESRRRIAELLAEGRGTGEVAALLGVTPGAISQARARFALSWHRFQGAEEMAI